MIYTEEFTAPPLIYFSVLPIRLYTPRLALQTPNSPSRPPAGPTDHQLPSSPWLVLQTHWLTFLTLV